MSGGCTFLHSGRAVPSIDAHYLRNEGVGISLDEKASEAWKLGGEVWKAVSSRIVTARLKVGTSGFQLWNRRLMSTSFLSIISVYVPTFRSSVAVKKAFYEQLQDTLDGIPTSDFLLILGDFNGRVANDYDLWKGVIGTHGLAERNQAGEDLLQFCELNQLTILNTWFEKKERNLVTWMHPATKNGIQ